MGGKEKAEGTEAAHRRGGGNEGRARTRARLREEKSTQENTHIRGFPTKAQENLGKSEGSLGKPLSFPRFPHIF